MAALSTLGRLLALSALVAATPPEQGQRWAVIAVGSKGFWNYRHQADGCHAYQLMLQSGIPASNIILMMQDDVANSKSNPFLGALYNRPGFDTANVYAGCKPDYRGDVVTAQLFLDVITGNESAVNGAKVLKSGPDDHVFLNFIDHGGPGIVAFPNGPPLHKTQLAAALKAMKERAMFGELVFYMEACESGSMFEGGVLPDGSSMYAVTASNARESSWGYYCMPDDHVMGVDMHTCLGDLFSISWMEDTDRGSFAAETVAEQVKLVTKRTNKSHVTQFGDSSIAGEPIGRFELNSDVNAVAELSTFVGSAVDVRDIPKHLTYMKWQTQTEETSKAAAWREHSEVLEAREADELVFKGIVSKACRNDETCVQSVGSSKHGIMDGQCHKALVDTIFDFCPSRRPDHEAGGWNAFNMQFSQVLVNLCEMKGDLGRSQTELEDIARAQCRGSASGGFSSLVV
jgi:legumain